MPPAKDENLGSGSIVHNRSVQITTDILTF